MHGASAGCGYRSLEATEKAAGELPAILRPEALATLSRELLRSLKDAVVALNTRQIMQLIEDVRREDEALGRALENLGNRYAYTAILTAIERAESEAVPKASNTLGMSGTA